MQAMIGISMFVKIWRHTIWAKEERPRVVTDYAYRCWVEKTWGLILNVGVRREGEKAPLLD
jgi:hypothetical protein